MSSHYMKKGYIPFMNLYETQTAIGLLKKTFETNLSNSLNLKRVSAPLFVDPNSGLNDNLNGSERPVSFDIPAINRNGEIVHSLAKWKRMALYQYGFQPNSGLYTDMNAIRRDEELDNLHSIYVDQWDWEKIITLENRNMDYLKQTVQLIVDAICDTLEILRAEYPVLPTKLTRNVTFITTEELLQLYPNLTPKQRENEITKRYGTVFLISIGDLLSNGERHDGRAPDYDDWKLNGDILFWNDMLECAFEVSSMGIRVDSKSLDEQLTKSNCNNRRILPFHQMLLNNTLPLTMGGGIGQSRLSMLLLSKVHIGEVQVSLWDNATRVECEKHNIILL